MGLSPLWPQVMGLWGSLSGAGEPEVTHAKVEL